MTNQTKEEIFETFVADMEASLDSFVEHGSDHELFLAGYLHGHFSLVTSEAQLASDLCTRALLARMQQSLSEAYENKELCVEDQGHADAMLNKLWDKHQ